MRATGPDISHWTGEFTYTGGYDFIIQKATEGWSWTDPRFEEFLPEVQKVPIRGAYHYFRTALDPIAQANHFWSTVKDKGFHFLVVDYEGTNNNLNKLGADSLQRFWDKMLTLIDCPLLLYTSPYVLRDNLCIYNKAWERVDLWMAHYNGLDPQNAAPTVFGAQGWVLWQYTNVGGDKNVYNGTVEQMRAWLKIGEEPMNGTKPIFASKINWAALIVIAIGVLQQVQVFLETGDYSPAGIATLLMGCLILIFRTFFTEKKIEL